MIGPRVLTEGEIRGLMEGQHCAWSAEEDDGRWIVDMGPAPYLPAEATTRLAAAAPDLAHTALEAMREREVLASWIRTNTVMTLLCDDGYADATHVSADGLIHRSVDAPAGSVRVVP